MQLRLGKVYRKRMVQKVKNVRRRACQPESNVWTSFQGCVLDRWHLSMRRFEWRTGMLCQIFNNRHISPPPKTGFCSWDYARLSWTFARSIAFGDSHIATNTFTLAIGSAASVFSLCCPSTFKLEGETALSTCWHLPPFSAAQVSLQVLRRTAQSMEGHSILHLHGLLWVSKTATLSSSPVIFVWSYLSLMRRASKNSVRIQKHGVCKGKPLTKTSACSDEHTQLGSAPLIHHSEDWEWMPQTQPKEWGGSTCKVSSS